MIYDLAGVARLGDEADASAFLIPFFRTRASNQIFAQDLDEARRIARFLVFDPFLYTVLNANVPKLSREIGDMGVMAFVRRGQSPVVGDAREIVAELRVTKLSGDQSPFFEIDAYRLTGQTERVRGALRRARRALGDGPIAARWSATEAALIAASRSRSDEGAELHTREIDVLAADFGLKDWPKRWLALWNKAPVRDRLIDLGLNYIERSGQPVSMTARVLMGLLRRPLQKLPSRTVDLADLWMEACARVQPTHTSYPRVWRAIAQSSDSLSDEMVRRGLEYLGEAAAAGRVTAVWASVAATLRQKRPGDDQVAEDIFQLARKVLTSGRMPTLAQRPLVKALLADRDHWRAIRVLQDWVTNDTSHSNAWIDAFLTVLEARGSDAELLSVGLTWLEEDTGQLRRWKQVYEAIDAHAGPAPSLHVAARDWVLRANRQMLTWPEVVLDVLTRDRDPAVEAAAREWLLYASPTPTSLALEQRLAWLSRNDGTVESGTRKP
ncbi:hypothetical protein [Brevundimonas olei]|uniref:hypothetical protein n=1 Tax=Brevundimonas olei TaxID=657642 RepID=UPI0031CF6DD0